MKKLLTIPSDCWFCKNCFNLRREGSAYCGECKGERYPVFIDEQKNFPLLKEIKKLFPLTDGTILTYGDTVYGDNLDYGLVVHELTHVTRQLKVGADIWWEKYLKNEKFRVSEEIAAYRNQYQAYLRKNLFKAVDKLDQMAKLVSGPLYGGIISFADAKRLIGKI